MRSPPPDRAVAKYLARHAEPEAAAAARLDQDFGHVVVVPAYGEGDGLFRLLGSVPGGPGGSVLVVLVVNSRAESPEEVHAANEAVRERLRRELPAPRMLAEVPRIESYDLSGGAFVLVDRARPGSFLPEGQGVGLARKIGFDFALALRAAGRLRTGWIHSTDADTVLPRDYFERLTGGPDGVAAAVYPFEHEFAPDPLLATAARLYEISLRYYVLGLAWAGSPYAYQSMGSCLAVSADAYARVRGFPRRNALEDFYALNKLAKVGLILRLSGTRLVLEGRISERVPISTGKALSDLVRQRQAIGRFRLYHPAVFAHLAAWLRVMTAIARSGGKFAGALEELPSGNPFFRADLLQESLESLGAFGAIRDAAEKSSDERTFLRHLHTWFDAFRTLKLIHHLRRGFPSIPYWQALKEAPFTGLSSSVEEDVEKLRVLLSEEESRLDGVPAGVPAVTGNQLSVVSSQLIEGSSETEN